MILNTGAQETQVIDELTAYVIANGIDISGGAGVEYKLVLNAGDITIKHANEEYAIYSVQANIWFPYIHFFIDENNYNFYFECYKYTLTVIEDD